MELIIVLAAFIAVASGAAVCPCPKNIDPVCGSDGTKYDNKCLMECQGATEVAMDECVKVVCACPYILWPVCGKDGETYPNECSMKCKGVEMEKEGECDKKKRSADCPCTKDLRPVCGEDGETYPNVCSMECAGVVLKHEGPCGSVEIKKRDACDCPPQLELPVCGKDGITYNSMCELGCAGTQFRFLGRCPVTPAPATTTSAPETTEAAVDPVICTADYVPVCGDDGVTYGNLCGLEATENVKLSYEGECKDDNRRKREVDVAGTKCACPDQIDLPVCGKDGITYNSMCAIGCAGTQFRFLGNCPVTPAPATTAEPTTTEAAATSAAPSEEAPVDVIVVPCSTDDCSDDN